MRVDIITQPFLLRLCDIDIFEGSVLLDCFKILHRGRSISTNIIAISKITGICKEDNEYVVEL